MIKPLLVFLFLVFSFNVPAQVGIGTTDPKTTLDVVGNAADASSLDGITAPRMTGDQLAAKTYTAAQNGAMVYVTAAATSPAGQAADVSAEGLYVYSSAQSKWLALKAPLAGGGSGWALTGNAATATDFLGTTNSENLRIRTGNVNRFTFTNAGQLQFPNGGIELGTSTTAASSNIAIGNTSAASATGGFATAVGESAVAGGTASSSYGTGASATGSNATAIGNNAQANNFPSSAFGYDAQANAFQATAIGGQTRANFSQATALGVGATASNTNATAIGANVSAPNPNTVVVGNNANVGLGTNNPQAKLHVEGSFRLANGTQAAGRVLTSDANGTATWQAAAGGSGSSWSLSGNSITSSNFLGSTNYESVYLRVNNTRIGRFNPTGGISIGFQSEATANNSLAIGYSTETSQDALALGYDAHASGIESISIGKSARSSFQNIAIGLNAQSTANNAIALGNGTTATSQNSLAIGNNAGTQQNESIAIGADSDATGERSLALGFNSQSTAQNSMALGPNSVANQGSSVALGNQAQATGNDGVAIGRQARATGSNTTAVGVSSSATGLNSSAFGTGATAGGAGATAIGKGANASQNSSIVIGDHTDSGVSVGIGTNTPTAKLQVNGTLRYVDATPGDDNGKVLTSDANGNATWQAMPQIVAAGLVIPTGGASTTFTTPKLMGASVVRNSKGNYQVTFSTARPNANYIINLANVDCNGDCDGSNYDDPAIAYRNRTNTGFLIIVGDNDNGTTNRSDRDLEFSFSVIDF